MILSPTREYSSLFTFPSQIPINRAFPSGEELAQLFTTLHHSSPKSQKLPLLDASHLVIGEPIRGMLMAKLIHNLCIELVIIDDRTIVYIPERSLNHFRSSSQMIRFL